MSLEKNIERIANALEAMVQHLAKPVTEAPKPEVKESVEPKKPKAKKVEAPKPPEATPPPPPQVEAPAAPKCEVTTPEELNEFLVAQMQRLGNREPIDNVLKEMGHHGIRDLPHDEYATLVEKVKAL